MKLNKKETNNHYHTRAGASGAVMLAVLSSVLLSAPTMAATIEKSAFIKRCTALSQDIHRLMNAHPDSPCTSELKMAASSVEMAEKNLKENNAWKALSFINKAEYALTDIITYYPYCKPVAPRVKPILMKLISVQDEIETHERFIAMRQVSLF